MFEMRNIAKSYGDREVLKGVSLRAEKGKPVCLFGPSGCGKTTLLNIAAGLLKADEGEIIKDKNAKISYVFQEDRLLPHSTAEENIMLSASDLQSAEKIIKAAGIEDFLKIYPGNMSGGMKRRVAIARAAAHNGDIFLLDEPFNGIDPERKKQIADCLRELTAEKICVMVSHERGDAQLMDAEMIDIFG